MKERDRIFIDSGGWIALAVESDCRRLGNDAIGVGIAVHLGPVLMTKHVVRFEEAAHALAEDPRALDVADALDPSRITSLAISPQARILYIVSLELGPRLRIISARRATTHERRIYADQT